MVRFDGFELDEARRELRGPHGPVHMEPQAFDLLVHLVREHDRVVPKHELLDAVWGHRHVGESALTTRIKEVRRALGDDGTRQAFVANVRGRGYRFVARVEGDGGSATEPPAGRAADDSPPPVDTTDAVVGRDTDVAGVLAELADSHLVVVVGPGGVGKTTVAREVVRHWRDTGRGPVTWVSLAEVRDPHTVVPAVAEALGVMVEGSEADSLADALVGRDDLVVLDDCERVVGATASLVRTVVGRGGPVRILATSRERLGPSVERVWALRPLDEPDARRLFAARARAAGVGVDPGDEHVGRVAAAVGGLPLALEMAAAQLPTMAIADLEDLVQRRLDLLRAPDRGAPDRHRTLGALVQWSLDLLDERQRQLLADTTTFAGAADPADVAAVLGADPTDAAARADVLDVSLTLAQLADRSLLAVERTQGSTRFAVPEVIRSVVGHDDGRAHVLAARHAEHFVAVARDADHGLRTPRERVAHDRITDGVPELRAAHRWAARHDPAAVTDLAAALYLYAYSRLWGEPVEWARSAGARSDPVVAALLAADATNRSRLGDAERLARAALDSGDPRATVMAREVLADLALYDGRLDDSARHAAHLRGVAEATGDTHLEVIALTNLALTSAYARRDDAASRAVDAMADLDAALAPSDRAWCRYTAGEVVAEADPAAAVEPLREAIALGEGVGNRLVASVARTTLATALHRTGDGPAALQAYATGLRESIAYGNHVHATTTLRNVVGVLIDAGAPDDAAVLLGALEGAGTKATFGAEAERLDAASRTVERSSRRLDLAGLRAAGSEMGIPGALALALAAVERIER